MLESLEKRFKIMDYSEDLNLAKGISYNDVVKQRPFLQNKTFIKEFTGEEEAKTEGELDEQMIRS